LGGWGPRGGMKAVICVVAIGIIGVTEPTMMSVCLYLRVEG
jgi:hypothetical protein